LARRGVRYPLGFSPIVGGWLADIEGLAADKAAYAHQDRTAPCFESGTYRTRVQAYVAEM